MQSEHCLITKESNFQNLQPNVLVSLHRKASSHGKFLHLFPYTRWLKAQHLMATSYVFESQAQSSFKTHKLNNNVY